jgi:hypothetical protein
MTFIEYPAVLVQTASSMQLTINKTRENIKRRAPGKLVTGTASLSDSINTPKLRSRKNL